MRGYQKQKVTYNQRDIKGLLENATFFGGRRVINCIDGFYDIRDKWDVKK